MRAICLCLALALLPASETCADSTIDFGFSFFYFDYKEDLTAPLKSTERGWIPGVYGSYEYSQKSGLYARVFTSYAAGDMTYDGSSDGLTPPVVPISFSDSRQKLLKIEGNLGYSFPFRGQGTITPFTGYGFRYWERGQSRITPTFKHAQEDYYWSYLPLGVRIDYPVNSKWRVGSTLQANLMFSGRMKAHLSQIGEADTDPEFNLGNDLGFYIDLPVRYSLSSRWSLAMTPWYEYSSIRESNHVKVYKGLTYRYICEPGSRTHQYGVHLGAGYHF